MSALPGSGSLSLRPSFLGRSLLVLDSVNLSEMQLKRSPFPLLFSLETLMFFCSASGADVFYCASFTCLHLGLF